MLAQQESASGEMHGEGNHKGSRAQGGEVERREKRVLNSGVEDHWGQREPEQQRKGGVKGFGGGEREYVVLAIHGKNKK